MRARQLINSAAIYTGANFGAAMVPLLLLPVMTRLLDPLEYGTVALFSVCVAVMNVFVGLSVGGAAAVQVARLDRKEFASFLAGCFAIMAVSALVVAVAAFLLAAPIERVTGIPARWLMAACLVSTMQFAINMRLTVLQNEGRAAGYATMQVAQAVVTAGLSVALVAMVVPDWRGWALGIVATTSVFAIQSILGLWREGYLAARTRLDQVRAALRFGIPLLPHVLGGLFIHRADQVVVAGLLGTAAAGIFSVTLQTGAAIQFLSMALSRAYAPWLYQHLPGMDIEGRRRVVRYTYLFFLGIGLIGIAFGIAAPDILHFLVGKAFKVDRGVMFLVSMGFAFGGMYFAVASFVFEAGATAKLAMVTVTCGLFNVGLTYALVDRFGLQGAGGGFMVSQAVFFLCTWRLAQVVNPMPWFSAADPAGRPL